MSETKQLAALLASFINESRLSFDTIMSKLTNSGLTSNLLNTLDKAKQTTDDVFDAIIGDNNNE